MDSKFEQLGALLLVAAIIAMIARRLRLPYSVGLVVAGIVLAFLPVSTQLELTKDIIFTAFLPPLIFEAALQIRWKELKKDLPVIITLATVGVLLSAAVTTVGMHYFAGWGWASSALFGVLIAATDPVSVIATFKEAGVHGRLRLLVESESLFNDSTAAVAFGVALIFATGGEISAVGIAQSLFLSVVGGIFCGVLVTGAILLLIRRTEDHLIELTFTTIAAYGSFWLAEHFHLSGILASLTAGLLVGNVGSLARFTEKGNESIESFWEYAAFVANSLIFILIGFREAQQSFANVAVISIAAILLVTLGRALAIYPCCALFARSSLKIETNHQHVLFWGGLRGALALALALGLPANVPHYEEIVSVSFAVVAFSLFAQGLTMNPLLRKLNQIEK
ncbi:MAG: sodium:proton antiporter [Acidobacteriota bacterium]|nr:sodium:proton antiporter [Acidobacteriota bacterium]